MTIFKLYLLLGLAVLWLNRAQSLKERERERESSSYRCGRVRVWESGWVGGVWGGGGGGRGSPLGQIDSLQEHKNSYCCTLHKSGWGGGGGGGENLILPPFKVQVPSGRRVQDVTRVQDLQSCKVQVRPPLMLSTTLKQKCIFTSVWFTFCNICLLRPEHFKQRFKRMLIYYDIMT